ncbi:hypothetical protein [Corynebacterium doosanense]|uniref:Secreted protein n=1 Tax=Corynebacterium doosanense CAU 212 = DSM 45436 TaxID=558173 RepID=A0A097IHK4_9CORY|nr:hypothetical protein [Corynebacterium doosanense]AIT61598.1 hypothetical protein CDOO_10210 [Corynebacterium doosanense CAU 212 = DSM 45436]
MQFSPRPRALMVPVAAALALALSSCSGVQPADQVSPGGSLSVSTSQTPTADAHDTAPIIADEPYGEVEDPGHGVTWHFQGTNPGNYGGTVVNVAVTNNNDAPLSPESLGQPVLRYNTGGRMEEVDLLETDVPEGAMPLQIPLDRPLGVGATTNLQYTFDVTRSNLGNAEFTFGNVTWKGSLIV